MPSSPLRVSLGASPASFAIDVGGTFTDCLATAADGTTRRLKLLSSGVFKGTAARRDPTTLRDPLRIGEPLGFWNGARLVRLDSHGASSDERRVITSDGATGELRLDRPFDDSDDLPLTYELTRDEPAPLLAIRLALGLAGDERIPTVDVRLGTTRGTNALLTRRGARTAWVTTRGFGDALAIGDQERPDLFDLAIRKPQPLAEATAEIDERLAADGSVLIPLDPAQARRELMRLRDAGIESLAICLLHAYRNPVHERQLERLAAELGFRSVRVSHRVAPLIKLVARGRTTTVDAYLEPVLRDYLEAIAAKLGPGSRLSLMTSAGDLVAADRFSGKDSLLSGPAGGVVGLARVAAQSGGGRGIGFDMGGTSTDVSRFDGRFEIESESRKAEVPLVVPTLAIETVAAGGGSICRRDAGRFLVGPESAGADPGPACYGRGGPLTVTDLNVRLGRVREERFPFRLDRAAVAMRLSEAIGGEGASGSVGDRAAATDRGAAHFDVANDAALDAAALGWWRIANAKMAEAIRSVSVAKGYDPRRYPLVAFGGAAAQHACAVAEALGMDRVLAPDDASILSAVGIGEARRRARTLCGVYERATTARLDAFEERFEQLETEARERLAAESETNAEPVSERAAEMRYVGTDAALRIERPADGDWLAAFRDAHRRRYGYERAAAIEVTVLHVTASEPERPPKGIDRDETRRRPTSGVRQRLVTEAGVFEGPVFERTELETGDRVDGPALIVDDHSTVVVDPGWSALRLASGTLRLDREQRATTGVLRGATADETNEEGDETLDPITIELFANRFQSIAEQMGLTLRNTATSVNVKERLDFSCALFDGEGRLVVNAPHIPVHLGAMSETVRCLVRDEPAMAPGDVYLTNDPYLGGSHLPDLTVITPLFLTSSSSVPSVPSVVRFFLASRAHHAEIGGLTPGSMPPFSKSLGDEGVILRHVKIIDAGVDRLDALRRGLCGQVDPDDTGRIVVRYPSRNPDENLADIQAQIAANRQGAERLTKLCREQGTARVAAAMRGLQRIASERLARALSRLGDGTRSFEDRMDDGSPIRVAIERRAGKLTIDFAGSAPVHPGNLNANRGIVTATVLYVLRCLMTHEDRLASLRWGDATRASGTVGDRAADVDTIASDTITSGSAADTIDDRPSPTTLGRFDVPLNHGLLEGVEIRIPEGILSPPQPSDPASGAAVVGGNVETSQRVVDVLLGALGIAAASQGTMNNLLFGNERFGYYETICGGAGATPWSDGADAVHTHMTNTRITDPEVLERRFPVRLWRFEIRRGSGGAGRHRGGNGVTREFEFLEPLQLSLLTNRRTTNPFGLSGGTPGSAGLNELTAAPRTAPQPTAPPEPPAPSVTTLPSSAEHQVEIADRLTIRTPGGGGWGETMSGSPSACRSNHER